MSRANRRKRERDEGQTGDGSGHPPNDHGRRHSGRNLLLVFSAAVCAVLGFRTGVWLARPHFDPVSPPQLARLSAATRSLVETAVKAVHRTPDAPDQHGALGLVYESEMMWGEAQRSFLNAVRLDPSNHLWRHRLARALESDGKQEQAIVVFRSVVTDVPEFAPSWQRIGALELARNDLDAAEAAFRHVIAISANATEGYTGLGQVMLAQNDYRLAVDELTRAITIDSKNKPAHFALGMAYRALGKADDARLELALGQEASALVMRDPLADSMPHTLTNRSTVMVAALQLLRRGMAADGAVLLERARREYPDDLTLQTNIGAFYNSARRFDDARRTLEGVLAKDPGRGSAYVNLGRALTNLGKPLDALALYDRALALNVDVHEVLIARSQSLLALQRPEEAVQALESAVNAAPGVGLPRLMLGQAYISLGRGSEGGRLVWEACDRELANLEIQIGAVDALLAVGRIDQAKIALNRAQRIEPGDPRIARLQERLRTVTR